MNQKTQWIIKKSDGELLKDTISGKVLFFTTATDAFGYIDIKCGGSLYLHPEKFVSSASRKSISRVQC